MYEQHSVSASQIRTYKHDPQRWRDVRLLGKEQPRTAAMIAGVKFHKEMETALVALSNGKLPAGVPPRVAHAARETASKMPLRKCVFEAGFELPLHGYTCINKVRGFVDLGAEIDGCPHIWDHKTLGNPDRALTQNQLRLDLQMNLYAWHALQLSHGDTATLVHNYVMRSGPHRRWHTKVEVTREQVDAYFKEHIEPTIAKIDEEWKRWQDAQRKEKRVQDECRILFYGTWPTKLPGKPAVMLHDWLAEEMDAVTKEQERLWCAVDFNAGPGYVLDKAEAAGKFEELPERLYIPAGDKLGELAFSHLVGSYGMVVSRVY